MIFVVVAFVAIFKILFIEVHCESSNEDSYYDQNIIYYGHNSKDPATRFVLDFSTNVSTYCDPEGKFAIIVPGFSNHYESHYVAALLEGFLKYRGGCVLFMDYYYFANKYNIPTDDSLQRVVANLQRKIEQIGNYGNTYLFGASLGSRVAQRAGLNIGNQQLERIDLCDPTNIWFDVHEDPKPAAKNVACIDLTITDGTSVYNCHQNFRMGFMGVWQSGLQNSFSQHALCPYYFISAFTHDFVPNNLYNSTSPRMIPNVGKDVKMGYNADFDRVANRGDIFIATAKYYPYVVENGVVYNKPNRHDKWSWIQNELQILITKPNSHQAKLFAKQKSKKLTKQIN